MGIAKIRPLFFEEAYRGIYRLLFGLGQQRPRHSPSSSVYPTPTHWTLFPLRTIPLSVYFVGCRRLLERRECLVLADVR